MACLNQDEIERLLQSRSKGKNMRTLRAHVEKCSRCQARLRELKANEELLGEMQGLFPSGTLPSAGKEAASGPLGGVEPFLTEMKVDAARIDIPAGSRLKGTDEKGGYEIVEEVGRGGAAVYRAKIRGRDIALKIIVAEPSTDADPFEQFVQEWERQNRITSDQVVRAYLPQRAEYEGLPLIVLPMEYAPEGNFRRWLNDHYESREDRLSTGLELFLQVCVGVAAIHRTGQMHLDIKPENVLLFKVGPKLTAKIADFGIARSLQHVSGRASSPFICCGTPEYMAPEQFSYLTGPPLQVYSDIYSLGVMLFELGAGYRPFDGNLLELKEMHLHRQPPKLTGDLRQWDKIIQRCMKKNPKERYACVEDLIREVNHVKREFSLAIDVACPNCEHVNIDATLTNCKQCDNPLPESFFRMCTRCRGKVRLDQEDCPRCGKQGIAAYYLLQERMARAEKLKDEDSIEAIELLELVLREGAGDCEARAAEVLVDLREKHEKIIPLCSAAAQAMGDGDIERAIRGWQDILTIIPRHREALRNTKRLKKRLGELTEHREKALSLMQEARFDKADTLLVKCLEEVPMRRDIREVLDCCRRQARQYRVSIAEANEFLKEHMVGKARQAIGEALSFSPRGAEIQELAKRMRQMEHQAGEIFDRAQRALSAAGFSEASTAVAEIIRLQADFVGLSNLQRRMQDIEGHYTQAVSRAQAAIDGCDLDEADQQLKEAIAACPDAAFPRQLLREVQQNKRQAKDCLEGVMPLILAAAFDEVEKLLCHSEEVWKSNEKLKSLRKAANERQTAFRSYMNDVSRALRQHDLQSAAQKLRTVLSVCPQSGEAQSLLKEVECDMGWADGWLAKTAGALAEARFEEVGSILERVNTLWPFTPGLTTVRTNAEKVQGKFERYLRLAHEARDRGDLDEGWKHAKSALSVCPKSVAASNLLGAVKKDRSIAKRHVRQAEDYIHAADFAAAEKELHEAHGKWSSLSKTEELTVRIRRVARDYHAAMDAAQHLLTRRKFERALIQCRLAIALCPESRALDLRIHIELQQRVLAARKYFRHQRLKQLMSVPLRLAGWLGLGISSIIRMLWLLLGGAVLGVGGVIGTVVRALYWFVYDHPVTILAVLLSGVLVLVVVVTLRWVFSDVNHILIATIIGSFVVGKAINAGND